MAGAAKSKPYFEETWFELFFLGGCFGAAYLLFHLLMPPVQMTGDAIQSVAMAKLFAEERFMDAVTRFNLPPVYPLLQSLVIRLEETTELPRLIYGFQQMNLWLYYISIVLIYGFIRRQIRKPYSFLITMLYTLAPATLEMAWAIGPQMAYVVLSVSSLIAIDLSLGKDSAMGGQISRGELLVCGSFMGASILTQQLGYTLLVAFMFVMIKRFGLRSSALTLAILMLLISPFAGRDVAQVFSRPQSYVESSASLVSTASHQGLLSTAREYVDNLLARITSHAVGDLKVSSLNTVMGTSHKKADQPIGAGRLPWLRWAIGLLAIIGAAYGLYQYTGIGTLYMCTYVITVLVLLPDSGLTLAPVLPLILFYLYFGIMRTGQWSQRIHVPLSKIAAPILTAWILLCSLTTHLARMEATGVAEVGHTPKILYMSTAEEPKNRLQKAQVDTSHRRAMEWLEAHAPQSARIAIPRPAAASLMANPERNTVSREEQQEMRNELARYDYLVEEEASPIDALRKRRGALVNGNGLKLVYEDVPGRIRIWQVRPAL